MEPEIKGYETHQKHYSKSNIKAKNFLTLIFITNKEKFKQQKWGKQKELTAQWPNQAPVPGTRQDKSSVGEPSPSHRSSLNKSDAPLLQEKTQHSIQQLLCLLLRVNLAAQEPKLSDNLRKGKRNALSLCRKSRNPKI